MFLHVVHIATPWLRGPPSKRLSSIYSHGETPNSVALFYFRLINLANLRLEQTPKLLAPART